MSKNIQFITIFTQPILTSMLLSIDKNKSEPIFDQIVNQIISLIENGDLVDGFQMPSTRQLASSLGVNRSTVIRAYEELWSLGYFESTPGSYTRVRKRKSIKHVNAENSQKENFWSNHFVGDYNLNYDRLNNYGKGVRDDADIINFQRLEPDSRLINKKTITACFRDALDETDQNIFGYCHSKGFEPLRKAIASHMRLHSVNIDAENVLITNGSQNSLQLIFQSFIGKDDSIAVETPTYSMLIPLVKYYCCKVYEIPMHSDGLDLKAFKKVVSQNKIKLIFTTPTFQNPTGITMSQVKREELLSICEHNNILIIEDSIEEELKYFGKVHLPIKSIDNNDMVIYLGTFSKILAPGLRLGWIIADKECIKRLTALKTIFDLSTNTFSQLLMYQYCKSGQYELHIRKCLRAFRKRMKTALKSLKKYLPKDKASWEEPLGGFLIWIKLNVDPSMNIDEHFAKFGVKVIDGKNFFIDSPKEKYIRLSIAKCNEIEVEEGIKRLGEGLKAID